MRWNKVLAVGVLVMFTASIEAQDAPPPEDPVKTLAI